MLNPSRYFNSASPDRLGRDVDLCYEGIRGFYCDLVRSMTNQNGGQRIAWDDPRSPFSGTLREFRPGTFIVQNTGPTTVYTDVYGRRAATTPFTGAIEQHFAGNHTPAENYIRGTAKDYAANNTTDRIHAPN